MAVVIAPNFRYIQKVPLPPTPNPLGPLSDLVGKWEGSGFNQIWRPFHDTANPAQDRFLELNETNETLEFTEISGPVPNRGLLQPDINLFGITYLQQISDAVTSGGLHIEPGIWVNVPVTTNPAEPATVARMASIPHGTTINLQGNGIGPINSGPVFTPVSIDPFPIGGGAPIVFPEKNLSAPTPFRSPPADIPDVTQAMVDNPNSVLAAAVAGLQISNMFVLRVSSGITNLPTMPPPMPPPGSGGGTANIAFLAGSAPGNAPNANAATVTATFWVMTVTRPGDPPFQLLQYTQTVLLNFNRLSWPHVSVATLRKF